MKIRLKTWTVLALTLALFACPANQKTTGKAEEKTTKGQSQTPVPQQQNVSTLETKYANCEDKMRPIIEKNGLEFKSIPDMKLEIEEVVQSTQGKATSTEVNVREKNSQYLQYGKTSEFNSEQVKSSRSAKIGLNDLGSINPLYFEISAQKLTRSKQIQISQRFVLESTSKDCELVLSQTSLSLTERKTDNSYVQKVKSIAFDGSVIEDKSAEMKLKSDEVLAVFADFEVTQNEINEGKAKKIMHYNFAQKESYQTEIIHEGTVEETVFGQKIKFNTYKLFYNRKNKKPLTSIVRTSEIPKISVNIMYNGDRYWTLPFDSFFRSIHLGQPQSSSEMISSLTVDYQKTSDRLRLKTKKKIDYENFTAYFKVLKADEQNENIVYDLEALKIPVTEGKFTAADLASNSTIQTDLPEIQVAAAAIKKTAGDDRIQLLQGVLDYLSKNYKYDQDMLKRNVIRPLTTKEAIDRKQGVCQHYAVIFTALARALGVPTRIIVGQSVVGSQIVLHAWNESEISSGKWQVIEPQLQKGLTETKVKMYFPMMRARFLEDREIQTAAEEFGEMFEENIYEFMPLN